MLQPECQFDPRLAKAKHSDTHQTATTGPVFNFSDSRQLVINAGTTIVTFTQNRDMSALHLKLDEPIRVSETARNKLLDLEDMAEEEELSRLKGSFTRPAGSAMRQVCPSD